MLRVAAVTEKNGGQTDGHTHTHTHTDRPTVITLAAHACKRGLINDSTCYLLQMWDLVSYIRATFPNPNPPSLRAQSMCITWHRSVIRVTSIELLA